MKGAVYTFTPFEKQFPGREIEQHRPGEEVDSQVPCVAGAEWLQPPRDRYKAQQQLTQYLSRHDGKVGYSAGSVCCCRCFEELRNHSQEQLLPVGAGTWQGLAGLCLSSWDVPSGADAGAAQHPLAVPVPTACAFILSMLHRSSCCACSVAGPHALTGCCHRCSFMGSGVVVELAVLLGAEGSCSLGSCTVGV